MLADYYNPKIVSVRQGYKQMAVRSVEILFNMIDLRDFSTFFVFFSKGLEKKY